MSPTELSALEIFVSVFIESFIFGVLFTYVSEKSDKEQAKNLEKHMEKIELEIFNVRNDIISEIKERVSFGNN